ncbi:MAG: hypothetical protein PHX13_01455 [Thiovulaceae bacterium]|nr:hypothetical protein [Sulfurimonadaceae bacterium]
MNELQTESNIVIYNDGELELDVSIENETVWLNRQQISGLFDRDIKTIGKHINNVFKDGELEQFSVVANFATTARDTVFTLFSKYLHVKIKIYTQNISKQLKLDFQKYSLQYKNIELIEFKKAHDRFLIIDQKEIYHIGASLKDLGKKWFAFSRFEMETLEILGKLK